MADAADWIAAHGNGVRVLARAQPRASRSALEGVVNGRLRVRIQAPPVEGAANEAVRALIAEAVGVAKSRVRVVRGETSREKTIEIEGLDADTARARLTRT